MNINIEKDGSMHPFPLGATKDQILAHFSHTILKESRGDATVPNSKKIGVSDYDIVLLFDAAETLVYVEFFSKPQQPRNFKIADVAVTYNKAMIQGFKDAGIKLFKDDEGGYMIPELNIRFTLAKRQDDIASLLYANDAYFKELLDLFDALEVV